MVGRCAAKDLRAHGGVCGVDCGGDAGVWRMMGVVGWLVGCAQSGRVAVQRAVRWRGIAGVDGGRYGRVADIVVKAGTGRAGQGRVGQACGGDGCNVCRFIGWMDGWMDAGCVAGTTAYALGVAWSMVRCVCVCDGEDRHSGCGGQHWWSMCGWPACGLWRFGAGEAVGGAGC